MNITPLEQALLDIYHNNYLEFGFPSLESIFVTERENTGVGRYTHLSHSGTTSLPDTSLLGLGKYSQFDMEGMEAGASLWVHVKSGKIVCLEILTNGDQEWDGIERPWIIRDPETGELLSPRRA